MISKIKTFVEDSGLPLTMSNFVSYYHIPLKTIYKNYSFSRLCVEAEVKADYTEPFEDVITKSFGKIVAIDSRRWIDFIDKDAQLGFDCPLDVHCTYTRDQLLIAMDYFKPNNVREGVKWLPDKKLDVFMVTLNKAEKDYSPQTMYEDYLINEEMFHWQSQNATSEASPTGQRYINHKRMGTKILLFVREFKKDEFGTAPYTYLGTASYRKHTGNKPMSITWHLDDAIPAKYLKKTNKLVVG